MTLPTGNELVGANQSPAVIKPVDQPDFAIWQSFWDWPPAWQHTPGSIERMGESRAILAAYEGEQAVGYTIFRPTSGGIIQLAVAKSHRRRGIAGQLLRTIREVVGPERPLSMINVDGTAEGTMAFFRAQGFAETVAQYEMVLDLRDVARGT